MEDQIRTDSPRSLCTISHESEEDRKHLEAAFSHWMRTCENEKWSKAYQWFINASFFVGNHYPAFAYSGSPGSRLTIDSNQTAHATRNQNIRIPKIADNKLIRPIATN